MNWNWQPPDWPQFTWQQPRVAQAEQQFLVRAGILVGEGKHLNGAEREQSMIEAISTEAVTLDLASVQSFDPLRSRIASRQPTRQPGGTRDAEMMVDLCRSYRHNASY